MSNFEFASKELEAYENEIKKTSSDLIKKIIEKHSPIRRGEIVAAMLGFGGATTPLIVTDINLHGIRYHTCFERLSFSYEGLPPRKDGGIMKNRKKIWFASFKKNGRKYFMPSYLRHKIEIASLIK